MTGMFPRRPAVPRGKTALFLAIAASLAAAAAVVHRKSAQAEAEAENPPQGRFLDIDGVRLHYTDRGEGDVIVLLHGNGSLVQDFELAGVTDTLAQRHRVISFDRPGFGYTTRPVDRLWNAAAQADLIHAALMQLDIDASVIVGHSWGTTVAVELALKHPESVRRLVLLSGYYYPTARLDVPFASVPAIPLFGTVMRHTLSPLISRLMWPLLSKGLFSPAGVTESFRRWPVWMTLRPSELRASAAETAIMVPQAMQMANRYEGLKMPVTIMAGDGDRVISTEKQSKRLHAALPHSKLRIVPEAGHMVHHIAPEAVIAAIEGGPSMPAMPGVLTQPSQPEIPAPA